MIRGKRTAYVAVIDDKGAHRLGLAVEGEAGYHPAREDSDAGGSFATRDDALACAQRFNDRLGISAEDASRIVASSMVAS